MTTPPGIPAGSAAEHQQQQQDRARTQERMAMDGGDMADTIDSEMDQKVEPGDESRYEAEVDEVIDDE